MHEKFLSKRYISVKDSVKWRGLKDKQWKVKAFIILTAGLKYSTLIVVGLRSYNAAYRCHCLLICNSFWHINVQSMILRSPLRPVYCWMLSLLCIKLIWAISSGFSFLQLKSCYLTNDTSIKIFVNLMSFVIPVWFSRITWVRWHWKCVKTM